MPETDDPTRTVFQPRPGHIPDPAVEESSAAEPPPVVAATPEPAPPVSAVLLQAGTTPPVQAASPVSDGQIPIGTVLNHIYRIDRLIARGGMGEVYEGTNVSDTEDRVAIKIILPHLAGDANVQALFRAEARTLTKFAHPGLVQYRLLALEPQLQVLYIVTEFVDGPSLSDVLSTTNVSPDALAQFMRRLASALAAAHALGKVHRDLSPDNILLPHGMLDHAKIIDFGIAKDLAAAQGKTIVGAGFAGKLSYVAPEQFGHTADVGPWTDVYSLGLVALALVLHRAPDMGANFSEAVDKRKQIPDLTRVPSRLRAVFARMLQPDRAKRFQSMNDLVAAIDEIPRSQLQVTGEKKFTAPPTDMPPVAAASRGWPYKSAFLGVAMAALLIVAAVIGWRALNPPENPPHSPVHYSPKQPPPPPPPPPPPAYPEEISGVPQVTDTATLSVNGQPVSLAGIDGFGGVYADGLRKNLQGLGNSVKCERVGDGPTYNCLAQIGTDKVVDLSELVLLNGAARTNGGASNQQKAEEAQARAAHRGMWVSLPSHPHARRHRHGTP